MSKVFDDMMQGLNEVDSFLAKNPKAVVSALAKSDATSAGTVSKPSSTGRAQS